MVGDGLDRRQRRAAAGGGWRFRTPAREVDLVEVLALTLIFVAVVVGLLLPARAFPPCTDNR